MSQYDFPDASGTCPETMKAIQQLRFDVWCDTNSVVPGGWSSDAAFQLSCGDGPGNGYCMHGDFINGWYKDAVENMMMQGGGGYEDGKFVSGSHASAISFTAEENALQVVFTAVTQTGRGM